MTSLHHDRPVDGGRDTASAAPASAAAASRRPAGEADGTVIPPSPAQRQGKASRTGAPAAAEGPRPTATRRPAGKAVTAAGSLAARAKAATTAAAGSTAARSAAARAATARTAAAKAATAGATTARTAAARATTAAKAAAATKVARPAAKAPATPAAVGAPGAAKAAPAAPAVTDVAAPEPRPRPRPRPVALPEPANLETPVVGTSVEVPVVEVPAAEVRVADVVPAPVDETSTVARVVPDFVDQALAQLPGDEAGAAPAPGHRGRRTGRHRVPIVRRRAAFYLAAGLVGALSLGVLTDSDPSAHAASPVVAETVSVAEQLGIEPEPAPALADADSTRLLQEMVVSRNERDAASAAAANAQATADFVAFAAAVEAARPKVVAPINGARLSSPFGAREGTLHAGVDLAAPMRTPEYAVMDGVVLQAGPASGFGLAVYIQLDNGDVTVYGHMDEILVEAGQVVRAGDTVALVGNRGQSTGPHLHFEVRRGGLDGTKVDPLPWLRERGVQL